MQPITSTKPVMDVSVPRNSAAPSAPLAQASSELPVRPAPFAEPSPHPIQSVENKPILSRNHRHAQAAAIQPHFPVALVTVTVFIMLVLSALAVTVYMTSKTA
jgi:hypothetical protein